MNNDTRCTLTIEAERDTHAPAQILGLVTQRNELPHFFSSECLSPWLMQIVLETAGRDGDAVDLLARRIAGIPSVLSVTKAGARAAVRRN
jgi:hypothetical protein